MKTVKFISVLGVALLFLVLGTGFTSQQNIPRVVSVAATNIQYLVLVHPSFMTAPCTTYQVLVRDENGRIVAPPQDFVAGNDRYLFREKLSRPDAVARRVAELVPVEFPGDFICENPLVTPPDAEQGPFLVGHEYVFNLFPQNPGQIRL
jgi:hypothetical protein